MNRTADWVSEDLDSINGLATDLLCDLGQLLLVYLFCKLLEAGTCTINLFFAKKVQPLC